MKYLYIVRHAKSSWDHPGQADDERPLIDKGIKRTELIAEYLLENDVKVDMFLSSHAVRAYETAKIIAEVLGYPDEKIQVSEDIYNSNIDILFNHLFEAPDNVNSIMMFGHNPTFTHFANYFLKKKLDWLPTTGVVCIEFDTDSWVNILSAKKRVKFVISPKMVKDRKTRNQN